MLRLSLLILALFWQSIAIAADKSTSAQAFAQLAEISALKISPDGQKAAAFRNRNGQKVLTMWPIGSKDPNQIKVLSFDEGEFSWFEWANNERLVFALRFGGKRYGVDTAETRLLAVNWDRSNLLNLVGKQKVRTRDSKGTRVAQIQDKVVSFLPNDPDHLLLSLAHSDPIYPDVFKVNIKTAERERQVRNRRKVVEWYADHKGQIRAGLVHPDKGVAKWIFKADIEQDWTTLARAEDINEPLPFWFEAFDAEDSSKIYVTARRNSFNTAVYPYDTKTGKYGKAIAAKEGKDIDTVLLDNQGKVTGYRYFDEYWHEVYQNGIWKSLGKMLANNFPDEVAQIVSYSKDKKRFFIHVTSPTSPGQYFLLDLNEGALDLFAEQYPGVDEQKLATMHHVSYRSDKLKIPGYLTLPTGITKDKAKKLPTIIMPHGGPRSRDNWGYDAWVQFLATRGYAVLQMNYRGSTGYGQSYIEAGAQQWGDGMIKDIHAGTQFLIEKGIADPKRICMVGWSYGGYAALQTPIANPNTYKCIVAGAAVTDMVHFMNYQRKFTGYTRYKHYVKDEEKSLHAISPYHNLDKIKVPMLLLHGDKDLFVPVEQSERFVERAKDKDKTISYVEMPGTNHHLSREADRQVFFTELEKFLAKHI